MSPVGSVLCAAAVNSEMFIVGRAIAGFGAAGVLQGALSIISQVVPLEKRPLYLGIVPSVFVIAVTVGPVLGGVFTEHATWRWCFWINLPIGAVVLLGLTVFLKLRGTPNKDRTLPLAVKINNMDPVGCLVFIGANVFFLPFWFQGVKGLSPVTTGVDFIPLLLSQIVFLIITGGIVKTFGHYIPFMIVGEVIAIGGQAMLTQLKPDTNTVFWAAALVVAGIGSGMAMQLPYTAVAVVLSDEDIPVGNAIAVLFYQLGGAVAISMGQTITITTLLKLLPQRLPDLSPQTVITMGAANLPRIASTPEALTILREIWNSAVTRAMILGAAVMGATIPFTMGMEWLNSVRVAEERKKASEAEKQENQSSFAEPALADMHRGDEGKQPEKSTVEESG
ncbi:hypothetical protein DL769_003298 [Monosporascus sp. CRB-8-3]|nr:hypothetical protein DL769_003298 [Monosporascus sp. CRB-8-3]